MFDSTYDLFNAFSFGAGDMIQGAMNPEENFSKEHWLNSIGLAGMAVGARVPAGRAGSGTKATVNKVEGAKKTPNVTPKPKPDSGKMTIPTIQTLTGKLNWFKAHLPELRVVQDSTGGQHYVFSKRGDGSTKDTRNNNIVNEVKEIDFGKHIIKGKNGKKELLPNTKYVTNDNYKYNTDKLGRIVNVDAPELVLKKANRNKYAQANVGGKDRLPDDDGGHLIGAQFNGPLDIDNLVPQNSQINRRGGVWYEMENEWAKALKEVPPKKVSVNIEPIYSNNSMRPDSFMVEFEIEGQFPVIREIANKSGG
ncbi:DNA/RNA non-specific endonuclease [Virgibacillus halodenitrificans]|uniref:DNA/RNA non-specific endonuclease n=1 Tax=Virgibacillus halodenitrificans TaxID=1482 RepID=UPI001F402C64|nr:DNA/RNA non-specific endonuclease [Virgibacillus halodenitrificans]